ncbi:MAG: Crp/Fnr family transcriptional regulator [Ilumatobacteraceae bacterium]
MGKLIIELGEHRPCGSGDLVFLEGDRSHSVYACVAGRLRVFLTLPSGRELLLGVKSRGDEFGELSALDGRPRSASVAAIEPSVVAVLSAAQFIDAIDRSPALSAAVRESLSAALRLANDRLATRNTNSATVRTGRMLVELASMMMRHGPDTGGAYDVAITQSDLAAWIGATREATARALAGFRRAGLIETGRGRIVVLDVAELNTLVTSL